MIALARAQPAWPEAASPLLVAVIFLLLALFLLRFDLDLALLSLVSGPP